MDIVFIKGLVITTVIGIYSWERSRLQKLIFDLDMGYSAQIKTFDDSFDYIDYQKIVNFVNVFLQGSCFFLLETVAENIARALMLNFNILWIRVKVVKHGVFPEPICVGVIIERGNRNK